MPVPRILILFNEPVLPTGHPDAASEREILETVEIVGQTLRGGGFRVSRLGIGNDLQPLLGGLEKRRPDAVFNLFEGLADRPFTETVVAGVLEWLDVPFTGSPAETLTIARDKQRTKLMLRGAGLPTAPFFTVDRLPCPESDLPWPVIVKPAAQDASVGIEQGSVVTDQAALEARVECVLQRYGGPALVEQFIAGREFLASVLQTGPGDLQVLPLAEIVFKDPAVWPIYSYDAKWAAESSEYVNTPLVSPVELPEEQMGQLADAATAAYRLLNCRDYARIDMRVTADGKPCILEVNPNPFINSIALINGLQAVGRAHPDFVCGLARAALGRRKRSARRRRAPARQARMQEAS
ncbi:MAG: hypothetical protein ACJ8F7_16260 [Gemmataceae bacterium]